MTLRALGLLLATTAGLFAPRGVVLAQEAPVPTAADAPPVAGVEQTADGRTIYTPAFFTRFSPTDARDMLGQVPGFSIRAATEERGLGQVTGNVLINGQRLSTKSEDIFSQLSHVSVSKVERIEIVDGATFNIPGLTGQVANVITAPSGISGHFEYKASARPKYARPSYVGGEATVTGSTPRIDWTLSYTHDVGRGASGGPGGLITDATGAITERRTIAEWFKGDFPRAAGSLKWAGPGGTSVNLRASYGRSLRDSSNDERRFLTVGVDEFRDFQSRVRGYTAEVSGDADIRLGRGRLKLIGLDRFGGDTGRSDAIVTVADQTTLTGNRFAQRKTSAERIGRSEYRWSALGGNWELDTEAAFNRLDQTAQLFDLAAAGAFVEIPFPGGSGGVTEGRYEAILNDSVTLRDGLTLQVGTGGEYSRLSQTGAGGLARTFWRPKGSSAIAWTPAPGLDLSIKVSHTVGQLDFGDFLANASLERNTQNASNPRLVPTQAWNVDGDVRRMLGAWGSSTLQVYGRWFEDYIDIIPLPGDEEARGNIPSARSYGVTWTNTVNFDPLGWKGAKLDAAVTGEATSLHDPLTGLARPFSGQSDLQASAGLRHDVPGTSWAWGGGFNYTHVQPYYRLREVGLNHEGPTYTFAFAEAKHLFGLTVRFQVFNLTDGRALFHRTVWAGPRDRSAILFIEDRNLSVEPIFSLSVKRRF